MSELKLRAKGSAIWLVLASFGLLLVVALLVGEEELPNMAKERFDIAELFPVERSLEAGDVVCLNENGKADYCDERLDNKVLGVVSTSPAIVIKGDHISLGWEPYSAIEAPIALKGRVPVKVICNDKIRHGDLLASSGKEGYAMKKDTNKMNLIERVEKMEGTTIGKALENCEEGERKIMMWVD